MSCCCRCLAREPVLYTGSFPTPCAGCRLRGRLQPLVRRMLEQRAAAGRCARGQSPACTSACAHEGPRANETVVTGASRSDSHPSTERACASACAHEGARLHASTPDARREARAPRALGPQSPGERTGRTYYSVEAAVHGVARIDCSDPRHARAVLGPEPERFAPVPAVWSGAGPGGF